jgi:hypothetical protein
LLHLRNEIRPGWQTDVVCGGPGEAAESER